MSTDVQSEAQMLLCFVTSERWLFVELQNDFIKLGASGAVDQLCLLYRISARSETQNKVDISLKTTTEFTCNVSGSAVRFYSQPQRNSRSRSNRYPEGHSIQPEHITQFESII